MTFMQLEQALAQRLTKGKKTLAIAESCTGGLLGHRLTNIPGSSKFFLGGIITYSNAAKINLLKIPIKLLNRYGAVSKSVAAAMATRVRTTFKSDFGVSITGIAGPTGGSKKKPVGLTYIGVATARETICLRCPFKGKRTRIKEQAADKAIKALLEFL